MRPYGLPRNKDVQGPDILDGHIYARKASALSIKGKGGDIRSIIKSSKNKRATRRYWKRRERSAASRLLREFY